jgi:uncharacterized membrane protein YphA (DoxX/SURF4 family)
MLQVLGVARMLLGILFVSAGVPKIIDPAGFALAVYNYHILPAWLVNLVAVILPWVEVVAGMCLVLGVWIEGGALVVAGLLLVFTLALGFNLSRGLDIACGCFTTSPAGGKITWWYLLRDSSLLAVSLVILLMDRGKVSVVSAIDALRNKTRT